MSASDQLSDYLEQNPLRPGLADVRLKDVGVAVWALIGYLQAANGDIARVAKDYDLPQEAVEAAVAFYQQHQAVIDARLGAMPGQLAAA